jgi:hypothetical protein
MATVTVPVDLPVWEQVREVARSQGWSDADAVLILLGYGAAVHLDTPSDDPLAALGAARAELALLRHRVFAAMEAIRDLQMNITGLTASIAQAERSLAVLQPLVDRLRAAAPPSAPDADIPSARDSLRAFLARGRGPDRR